MAAVCVSDYRARWSRVHWRAWTHTHTHTSTQSKERVVGRMYVLPGALLVTKAGSGLQGVGGGWWWWWRERGGWSGRGQVSLIQWLHRGQPRSRGRFCFAINVWRIS